MRHGEVAFTLIELLVTVVLVAILVAMSVANFDVYRDKAYDSQLVSYAHQAIIAGEAGIVARKDGYTNRSMDPEGYKTLFLGLNLPNYIDFYGAVHTVTLAPRDNFYFEMISCKKKDYYAGMSFRSTLGLYKSRPSHASLCD